MISIGFVRNPSFVATTPCCPGATRRFSLPGHVISGWPSSVTSAPSCEQLISTSAIWLASSFW